MSWWRGVLSLPALACALAVPQAPVSAQTEPPPEAEEAGIEPLRVAPPGPPQGQYDAIVKDKQWLVALGKALFWDSSIGSDGVACASCHFNAGADPRLVNQLNPGILRQPLGDATFGGINPARAMGLTRGGLLNGTGKRAAPNIRLETTDFPFRQLADTNDRNSAIRFDTNDVASSQGVFDGGFISTVEPVRFSSGTIDFCSAGADPIFRILVAGQHRQARRVEPRNTPTMINAAFYHRNFWDGRANNVFNGESPFGLRDRDARILRLATPGATGGGLRADKLELKNMSLASQAVGPPNSDFEMACGGRTFAAIGRKVLPRVALSNQRVAPTDSVFGGGPLGNLIITPVNRGLKHTYTDMVQRAFKDDLWSGTAKVRVNGTSVVADAAGFTQAEQNFDLFFGMAIDAYERTLISDDTPFDNGNLTAQEQAGRGVFEGKGKCTACHVGPLFSGAAIPPRQEIELVENMIMGDGGAALYDGGFYNIGVRPTFEDDGVGGKDPFGNPLSFSRQITPGPKVDRFPDPIGGELPRVAVDGAFKTPTLRNVALTAPYFHNGGEKSLEDVVEFYNRGGNRRGPNGDDTTGSGPNGQGPVRADAGGSNLDADIQNLGLTAGEKASLVAFMKALTDRRVSCHAGPFDHPELVVSNGHKVTGATNRAADALLRLREVGRAGYGAAACAPNTGNLFTYNLIGAGKMLEPLP